MWAVDWFKAKVAVCLNKDEIKNQKIFWPYQILRWLNSQYVWHCEEKGTPERITSRDTFQNDNFRRPLYVNTRKWKFCAEKKLDVLTWCEGVYCLKYAARIRHDPMWSVIDAFPSCKLEAVYCICTVLRMIAPYCIE